VAAYPVSRATSTMTADCRMAVISPSVCKCSVRRYYDPYAGQFMTVDPLVDETGQPYVYVNGDPVDSIDPLGLGGWSWNPISDADTIYHGATHGRCPARRGISRRRSRCDGQALRTIAASLLGVCVASE